MNALALNGKKYCRNAYWRGRIVYRIVLCERRFYMILMKSNFVCTMYIGSPHIPYELSLLIILCFYKYRNIIYYRCVWSKPGHK